MSDSAGVAAGPAGLAERSRTRRMLEGGAWLAGLALVVLILQLAGVDVIDWLRALWDQIKAVPAKYIVVGLIFQTGQTIFAGLSYYGILSAAYPGEVAIPPIVAAYAVGVAMNNFLPANIGTFVTLMMFIAIIPACTFGGSIAAYLVQKIFFPTAGTFIYLSLFLSVPGSFDLNLGNLSEHPTASVLIAVGGAFLIVVVARIFWRQVKKLWAQAKQGGVILSDPRGCNASGGRPAFVCYVGKFRVSGTCVSWCAAPACLRT